MIYIYHDIGSCNDGDHDCRLTEFPETPEGWAQGEQFMNDVRNQSLARGEDGLVSRMRVIKGEEIKRGPVVNYVSQYRMPPGNEGAGGQTS